jgi:hypothetical protein
MEENGCSGLLCHLGMVGTETTLGFLPQSDKGLSDNQNFLFYEIAQLQDPV